jgi:putative hemolysin
LIWVVVCFLLGAYYSAMETAYTSFDRILIESWRRADKFGTKVVYFFTSVPERFLTTTLIGTNVAEVAYSALLVAWALDSGVSPVAVMILSPIVVLIFGSILPKMIAYGLANGMVRFASLPLHGSYYILSPLRWFLFPLMKLVPKETHKQAHALRRSYFFVMDELDLILQGAEEAGAASPEESELLSRYLDARELKARQIMTPRTEMVAVSSDMSITEVREVFEKCRHNILPVYRESPDQIIGYVRARDFLREQNSLQEITKPILAVPESKPIVELLEEFRATRRQAAIVIDEHGGTDGLVTIKDIFAELVGPVAERWDPKEPIVKRIAPGRFLASGSAFLEDIERVTGWEPPAGEYTTLSGLLSEHLGRIAEAGEDIDIEGVTIRIIRRNPRRVEGCLLKLPSRTQEDE